MTNYTIDFRGSAGGAVLPGGAAEAIALLSAQYQFNGAGLVVVVNGVSRALDHVDVALRHEGGESVTGTAPDVNTGLFSVSFVNLPIAAGGTIVVEASSSSGSVTDFATWRADREGPSLSSGSLVGLPPARQAFVAGVPDRVLRSRFFTPLFYSFDLLQGYKTIAVYHSNGTVETIDVKSLGARTNGPMRDLIRAVREGAVEPAKFRKGVRDLLKGAGAAVVRTDDLKAKHGTFRKGSFLAALRAHYLSSGRGDVAPEYLVVGTPPGKPDRPAGVAGSDVAFGPLGPDDWALRWENLLGTFFTKEVRELPVGILFTDRLRFQPAGLVMGERIYALSLAAGEEVQLRQVVETKRQSVSEDVKDREAEQQLTLSSTWTTEITEVLRENQSRQSSSTTGLSGNADLTNLTGGFVPITVGGSASFSGSQASDTTTELSQRQSREATATASTRMRSQHRIRLEVTNETSSSMATTRTIRNPNRQRNATLLFHKIYRKERVSLERTNAQLCLRLMVNNPAVDTRAAFIAGLRKLDPNDESNYNLSVPQSFVATWDVHLDSTSVADYQATGTNDEEGSGYNTATIASFNLADKFKVGGSQQIPANYGLAEQPTLTIKSYHWGNKKKYGLANFEERGGEVEWTTAPKVWTANPTGAIKTTMYWVKDKEKGTKSIHNVRATFSSLWVPTGADLAAYSLSRAQERSRLTQALAENLDQIYTLRDIAVKSFPGQVLAEAADRYFPADASMAELTAIFDLGELFIEVVPHWATKQGRQHHDALHARLERLPAVIPPSDILVAELTASLARVYLPVKEGMESQAIQLLESIQQDVLQEVADDVRGLREGSFPYHPRVLNTPAEICGPQPPQGTPIDGVSWQNDWEKTQREFQVLAQWQEFLPTDGIHMETALSDSVSTDESLTDLLMRNGA